MLKRTLLSLALAMTVLPLAACNDDDNDFSVVVEAPTQNIAEIAAENKDLTILNAALKASGLDKVLMSSEGEFTVFAPTDAAFAELLEELDVTSEELLADKELLTMVLTYHVIPNMTVKAADIPYGDSIETVNGQAFSISDANIIMDASGYTSKIIKTDVLATNGVIHLIDDVLLPTDKSIVDLAVATEDLSILKEAVVAAGLADALADEEADFTVFAPNNAAFAKLLAELEISKEQLLQDKPLLTKVLTYHVIEDDRVFASEIMAGSQEMLEGSSITFDDKKQITDGRDRTSNIVTANIQANNGVVHVIDTVLLPK
ncbi:putative surface protein with fasciclin (FAS1) repeats [Psychrobacter immobilis]|uniref:Putative surface protein with fasciclin (FAS1) repeats n=1 Tax=Psychrobacter immobilis TaxID=498 RepID=A0A2V2A056_PSYIM|nr:fasciclin domain-containing protein [Psychrobacter immobilis]PWK11199.1 putative surface protein with fasciclin (FAS1) repeats [Psychrobacter immobilis]